MGIAEVRTDLVLMCPVDDILKSEMMASILAQTLLEEAANLMFNTLLISPKGDSTFE